MQSIPALHLNTTQTTLKETYSYAHVEKDTYRFTYNKTHAMCVTIDNIDNIFYNKHMAKEPKNTKLNNVELSTVQI